jgi:hypothetical protein
MEGGSRPNLTYPLGKSSTCIGVIFGISPRTVEKHVENLYVKSAVDYSSGIISTPSWVMI